MKNIRLIIEYDGTQYCGWQRQNNGMSIQQVIEEAIKQITNEQVKLIGSSRTDAGVHAKGFVANFVTNSKIPSERFKNAINAKLPEDIVIIDSSEVEESFHARYSAKGKKYSYSVLNRPIAAAICRAYTCQHKGLLNCEAMREGAKAFIGTHDFSAFKSSGSSVKTTVRTIYELEIVKHEDNIMFYVSGDGFLYNMVRIIVGTLLEVGSGKIKPIDIVDIIDSKDRDRAGKCVPAKGLCLEKVYY
ncbi:MAG: tRNA pseudouridine(38-40) synthase TruA [Bacillota bacterium]|nr:tRNA pseudouridine(38-40) synthase TruA [Bacillota bacterium]